MQPQLSDRGVVRVLMLTHIAEAAIAIVFRWLEGEREREREREIERERCRGGCGNPVV